jgi:predicted nuclease with TOPRIM domain
LEAKKRIAALGSKQIAGFLAEVPLSDRKVAYGCIKSVTGFRPDSESALKEKGRRFVSALTQAPDLNSKSHTAEWAAFSFAWLSWAKQRFQSQFPSSPDEPVTDEHEALATFIRKLVPDQNFTVCREDVERLLIYSGFALTDKSATDLSWIPTRSALDLARKAAKIPAEVESLKRQLKSRESEIAELRGATDAIRAEAETLRVKLAESCGDISEIRAEFSEFQSRQDNAQSRNGELARTFEQEVRRLESRLSVATEDLKSEFAHITEKTASLTSSIVANQEAVARLENVFTSLQERFDMPAPSPISDISASIATSSNRPPDVQFTFHSIATEQPDLTVTLMGDAKTALSVITRNLSAIGVRKDDAVLVAATVLAGVVAGQLVQVKGSFAELVVEAVAAALSDSPTLSWRVPLGLLDGSETDFVLSRISNGRTATGCIAVIGANKSAFEVYGDRLTSAVAKMQLGIKGPISNVPLMATFVGGSGVLPSGPEFCCLGPSIDSDALIWGRANKHATVTIGRLSARSWADLVEPTKTDEDIEPVIRALPNFSFAIKLWERTARNALLILRKLDKLTGTEHSANFLIHWLLPWVRSNGMTDELLRDLLTKTEGDWLDENVIERTLAEASDATP